MEDTKEDGASPFLDTIVKPEADNTLSITVYRKPILTDQYLQWDSHHHLSAKYGVINTLTHRVKTVCSKPELLQKETDHLRKALSNWKYPGWVTDRVERRFSQLTREGNNSANTQDTAGTEPTTTEAKTKDHIVRSYSQGLCKSIKKICSKYGIQTHFRGKRTIKNILVSPKDKDPMEKKSQAIYWFQCGELACDKDYIRETARTFGQRCKEHLMEPSFIHHHSKSTNSITTHVTPGNIYH